MEHKRKKETQKHAAALQYNEQERIPRVLAGGLGKIAEEIIETASMHGIPVQKDEALAVVLSQLKPGELIPPETYRLAAELIAFLYDTDLEWRKEHPFIGAIFKNSDT